MAEPDPADAAAAIRPGRGNLTLRICSALLLAPLALATAYIGGWPFAAFWAIDVGFEYHLQPLGFAVYAPSLVVGVLVNLMFGGPTRSAA